MFALTAVAGCAAPDRDGSGPSNRDRAVEAPDPSGGSSSRAPTPAFVDRASKTGLDFTYFNGMSGQLYMVEMVGGGAALFDYDGDGDLDVYLVQGRMLPAERPLGEYLLPVPEPGARDRLFRNDLDAARGPASLRFVDVTEAALPPESDYGQGVATGDFDNDGHVDLVVTNYGENRLLHNRGDGRFESVPLPDRGVWSTSASLLDTDGDGWLDLFIANYLDATLENHFQCTAPSGLVDYCGPLSFEPLADQLLRNVGGEGWEDVSQRSGVSSSPGAALGVVALDVEGDGDLDVYVANDQMENFLWINDGSGAFTNEARYRGCALSNEGRPQASMGVEAADVDGDGDRDLLLSHLTNETNTLYLDHGGGLFVDGTPGSGLGPPSLPYTSFGTALLDYDMDGGLDFLVVSGTVRILEDQLAAGEPLPLRQLDQLFRNVGDGAFVEVIAEAGDVRAEARVGRGLATGDVDNDGDPDAVVINNGAPLRLLVNQGEPGTAWIGVRAVEHGRDALGAAVRLETVKGRRLWRWVQADGSYLSARDPRVSFGLGSGDAVGRLVVVWPDGSEEAWLGLAPGRYHTLRRGEGNAP